MKNISISSLKKKLDSVFSQWIRLRASDGNGYVQCYTCPKISHWKDMQCGHYVSRSVNTLRYDERNCRVQCSGCNIFKHGAMDAYALRLLKECGPEILVTLGRERVKMKQFKEKELREMIAYYQDEVSKLSTI